MEKCIRCKKEIPLICSSCNYEEIIKLLDEIKERIVSIEIKRKY